MYFIKGLIVLQHIIDRDIEFMRNPGPGIGPPIPGFKSLVIFPNPFRTLLCRDDDGIKRPFQIRITHFAMFFPGCFSIRGLIDSYNPGIGCVLLMPGETVNIMGFV